MNSIWKSLLWKEWREQRWRLMALTGLLALPVVWFFIYMTAAGLEADILSDYLNTLTGFASCYVVLAGCFIGMHVAGGENARRTMRFMQALPTPMWKTGLVKIFVGGFVAVIPLVILYGVVSTILPYLINEDTLSMTLELMRFKSRLSWQFGNIFSWSVINLFIGVLGTTSLLLWMATGGVNRSDEVRAGAIGFLICVCAWMVFAILIGWADKYSPMLEKNLRDLIPVLPGGPALVYQDIYHKLSQPVLAIIALISHGGVLVWYLKRFGRVTVSPKRAGACEFNLLRWMKVKNAPMHTQWQAIAWKQLRETGPLAALTVAGILLIVPVVYYFTMENNARMELGVMIGAVSLSAGFFVIQVAGIGVFLEDYSPGVNNFWRSRPINVHWWFVIKFVTGLAVLCLAFGTLSLLALSLMENELANISKREMTEALYFCYILVLLYTLGMASYCLLRQPIYAAVLTVGLFLSGVLSMDWLFPNPHYFWTGTVSMILALAIPITIAYFAVKHDWGWKVGR